MKICNSGAHWKLFYPNIQSAQIPQKAYKGLLTNDLIGDLQPLFVTAVKKRQQGERATRMPLLMCRRCPVSRMRLTTIMQRVNQGRVVDCICLICLSFTNTVGVLTAD